MICTSAGKASSAALVEIADLVDEYLPKLKALEGAVVNRAVCGSCLDFKIATTAPLATFFKPIFASNQRKYWIGSRKSLPHTRTLTLTRSRSTLSARGRRRATRPRPSSSRSSRRSTASRRSRRRQLRTRSSSSERAADVPLPRDKCAHACADERSVASVVSCPGS